MKPSSRLKAYLPVAAEVFLLFFGFVFSQAAVTFFLILPYVFAVATRLAAQGMGTNQALLEISRHVNEEFLPTHSATVTVISSLLAVTVLLLTLRKLRPPVCQALLLKKAPLKSFLLLFPLGVGLQILISVLLFWVMELPGMEQAAQQMEEYSTLISSGGSRLWELFAVVAVAPLCEELFFRGAIPAALKKAGAPLWVTIVLPAALFGLVHGLPLQMIYAFLIGVIFGLLTQKFGCLWHSVLLHALFNAAGYWTHLLSQEPSPALFVFLFVCAAAVCAAALLLIFYPKKEKGEPDAT